MTTTQKITIDEALTRKVAKLSSLKLTDTEVTAFTRQIGDVLGYIEQLSQADVANDTEPMIHPLDIDTPLREDVIAPFELAPDGSSRVVACAPDPVMDGYRVPQIVKDDE